MKKNAPLAVVNSREGEINIWASHTQMLDPAGLEHHPDNNNLHSADQLAVMKAVLKANGFREAIVVSAKTMKIVAGHLRATAAVEMGMEKVPVDLQYFEDRLAEIKHLTADNELARMATFDVPTFLDMKTGFEKTMDKSTFQTSFFDPKEFGLTAYPSDDEKAKEPKDPKGVDHLLEDGDKWKIGNHHLVCGEFQNPDEQKHMQAFLKAWVKHQMVEPTHVKTKKGYKELTAERLQAIREDQSDA